MLPANQLNCSGPAQYVSGTTVGSNPETINFIGCIDATAESGVWYRFVARGPDIEIIDFSGHAASPYVAIMDDNCASTTYIICQQLDILDMDGEGDDILITGNTYLLWIGFQGSTNTYDICITNPLPPTNDLCADAININDRRLCYSGTSATLTGTTEFASPDGIDWPCLAAGTNSWEGVWYEFTAQGYDFVVNDIAGNAPYIVLMDDGCAAANIIYCGQAPVDLTVAPHGDNLLSINQQYYMWVGFDGGNEEAFELCIDNPEPPINDECVGALPIQANIHCVVDGDEPLQGDIYGAFPETFDVAGCLPVAANGWEGIWYNFTSDGYDLIIETSGNEDPYIILWDGCPESGGAPLYCGQTPIDLGTTNEATGDITNNFLTLAQVPMDIYMWVGFDGGLDSTFTICVENPFAPQNDQCLNAIDISEMLDCPATSAPILGSTEFSTWYLQYVALPAPCMNQNGAPPFDEVVWYQFEAPGVDFEISDVMGNNPSFAILTYNECQNGATLIMCGEMPYSFDTETDADDLFEVGQTYIMMIAFDGGWQTTDSFGLCVNVPPPPPNDLCQNAEDISGRLDCPEVNGTLVGWTTNASQEGMNWTNFDPLTLPCAFDTTEDDGVWYFFEAIGTDIVIDDVAGNSPTILMMNYNTCIDTLSYIFCESAPIGADFGEPGNNALTVGNQYLMYVTFQGGEPASDTFELCIDNDGMCSSPTPPSSYCQTTPLCGLAALDAYCMNMEVNAADEAWPGCAVQLHDPNWFSFVAGADNLSIQVQVSDCQSNTGVQIEMYEIDCTQNLGPDEDFCPASDLGPPLANCIFSETAQAPGTAPVFTVPTEFGHVYGIVFDGWAGDLCTIEIDVLLGADPPSLDGIMLPEPDWDPTAFPFEGDTICAGAENVRFAIAEEVPGACRFDWTLNGMSIADGTNDLEEFIDFPDPGTYEVCFYASNFCDSTEPTCILVIVAPLDPYIVIDTICEGDDYIWLGPFGNPLTFDPAFSSEEGGDTEYMSIAVNAAGCEVDASLFLHVLEENDDNRTPIDTVVCDIATSFWDEPIVMDPTTGVLEGFEFDKQLAHGGMCDSFFTLDIYSLSAFISYATVIPPFMSNVNCIDSVITICPDDVADNPYFTPDPLLYPDVEIHYQWTRSPDQTPVGTDSICLIISFDEFVTTEHNFDLTVTMTKGGRPVAGCEFGPFDFDLDLVDLIPDSMNILGPDTVCIGPDYTYTIEQFNPADLWPMTDDFFWDLSQFPGAERTEILPRESEFTFTQLGTGLICVTAVDQCALSVAHCKQVVVAQPPPGDPGLDMEECTNTYTLNAGNSAGTWFTDDRPLGAQDPVFSDINSPTSDVTIIEKGEYTFGWITNSYGCADTAYVDIDFIEPMSLDGTINYTCDAVNENFTAVFDFIGGIAPFVVTSANGTLSGMTFTSDPITEGDTVVVLITDAQDCVGSFVLTFDCACLTEGAVMNLNQIESCGEVCVDITPFTPPVLDGNDAFVYMLHTSSTDVLGTVLEENTTGQFCYTTGGAIQYDVVYYASIVVGNALGTSVDLSDRCLQIAPGQPVVWYEIPAPDAGSDDATCDDTYQLNVTNSNYPGTWEIINSGTNVDFSDQTSPNSTLTALGCGVVELQWIETNEICMDTTLVTIEFYCNPSFGTINFTCNMAQTELIVSFPLSGVGPFTETNGRGVITGSNFEVMGLPLLTADTFYFTDGNGCELIVPVPPADCNCLPNVKPDTVCGLSLFLDAEGGTGNSGFWTITSTPTGESASITDVNARTTNVTVTDYGVYCFEWTEVGSLCQGVQEVCIPFVNSPQIDPSSIMFTCNANYDGYVITFDILEGDIATYSVFDELGLPLGSVIGNTFTSREIPSTQPVQIFVADGFMCDTFVLDTVHDCGCFTGVGALDITPLNLCIDDETTVIYNDATEMKDGNDVKVYILYSDVGDPIGSIISESPSGIFGFVDPPMVLGTTYYVSAVLGTEDGIGTGQVNYSDPCLSISTPMPVIWYDATTASIAKSEVEFTCLIEEMVLTVSAVDDINDYNILWTTTDGSIEPGDEMNENAQINSPGIYTVTLTHAIAGCSSSTTIEVDQSDDVPEARIAVPLRLTCDRTELTLSGAGSDVGSTIRYEWTGPGIVGDNTTLDITVNQVGVYTLTLIDDSNGCRVSKTVTVEEDLVEPAANASVAELLDCNTTELTVSGAGSATGGNIEYSWTVVSADGNIIGSTTGQNILVDRIGVYQIEVTDRNNGCTSTASVEVRADDSIIRGANISVQQPGCDGADDGQITFTSIDGGTGPFMYSFNGGTDFDIQPGQSDLPAGTYELIVTDDNGCEFRETVILTQPFDFTIELGETILIELGDTAFINGITNLPDSLLQSVSWTPLYDTVNQNTLSQTFIPDLGQHSVSLTVTNTNGCVQRDNVVVVVKFAERLYIPNVMRPTSSNTENQRIHIFADPESVSEIHSFAIYNRWGERMFFRTDIPVSLEYNPAFAWDGTWQDELAPASVYVYYAEVEFITGVKKLIKGDFTLVR